MRIFHICTIANDLSQYDSMKQSFLEAGFDQERCRYSLFDNSENNYYEPYKTLYNVQHSTEEPYLIFCHQDIRLDRGHGIDHLLHVIEQLNEKHPQWAVAGNAGVSDDFYLAVNIVDPNGVQNSGLFPFQVQSLDENFLLYRTGTNIYCSSDIEGFHLYGTDLCLQAIQNGRTCYVVNFCLTHLSVGNAGSDAFKDNLHKFKCVWNNHFLSLCSHNMYCFLSKSFSVSSSDFRI